MTDTREVPPLDPQFAALFGETYLPDGVAIVWRSRSKWLGGQRTCDVWATDPDRVRQWGNALIDGAFG